MSRQPVEHMGSPIFDSPFYRGIMESLPAWSPTPEEILKYVIIFTWTVYLWETYLSYRQFKITVATPTLPSELIGIMDQSTYTKSRLYNIDKSRFSFVVSLWEQILQTMILLYGGIPFLWSISERVLKNFGYTRQNEILHTLIFTTLGSLFLKIVDLPFSIYATFVIEQKHGFNKETPGFFALDTVKKFIVMLAVAIPITACIVYIVKAGGDYFFIILWFFTMLMTLVLATVYADFIAPLFDKFTPLEPGKLRTRIENLAKSINFPLKKLYVVQGSKRSTHSNAYLYGFFNNKRIVLFDTLIEGYKTAEDSSKEEKEKEDEQEKEDKIENTDLEKKEHKSQGCNDDEVEAVIAHELGHWKLGHVLKNIIIVEVNLFLCFAVFALLYKNTTLYQAFGFHNQKPVIIGLQIIFQYVFSPYNEVLNFLMTMLSRRFEFQADAFAKILHKAADLRSALIKLNTDNLGFPVHDWLYSAFHHSHPPVLQRIKALGKID